MIRRRDPKELFLLGLCLISGVFFLAGATPPSSVEQTLPGWLVIAWKGSLAAAGVVGILGNFWPGALGTALLVRLSGQLLASGPAGVYAVAVAVAAGTRGAFAAGITLAWAGVCIWTAKHLHDDLLLLRRPL